MSGKKKVPGKSTPGWGGKRVGSGRKKVRASRTEKQIEAMIKIAKKRAKLEGKTIDEVLLDIIYDNTAYVVEKPGGREETVFKISAKDKISAIKIWKEFTISKSTEQNVNINKIEGPAIGLPPVRQDPALEVVEGGKK